MDTSQLEQKYAGVRKWYRENRDEYNAKRRAKYKKSTTMQELAREKAREYRHKGVAPTRVLQRQHHGEWVDVYSSGMVASAIGRSAQMLRNWETQGWIPVSIFPDAHRLYTRKQMDLISFLNEVVSSFRHDTVNKKNEEIQKAIKYVAKNWTTV